MRIATYNVNSIRLRLSTVLAWLQAFKPDVLCLQETKVQDSEFPLDAFAGTGYFVSFRGMKAYNGIAILSRREPERVTYGLADRAAHQEGKATVVGASYDNADETRFGHAVINGVHVLNTYVPQGYQIDSPKYAYKLEWFKRLRQYFETHFQSAKKVVWCGDLNVAPRDMDVHSPEKHLKHVCFHADVREAYRQAVAWGFKDVFVELHPDETQYTFFDYRKFPPPGGTKGRWLSALEMNKGWRIDHILATPSLADKCQRVEVDLEPRRAAQASDHTFLWAEFDL